MKLKTKLNKALMIDTLIAAVIGGILPDQIRRIWSAMPAGDEVEAVLAAGLVYVGGGLMKKPNVASIGVSLVAADYLTKKINLNKMLNAAQGITSTKKTYNEVGSDAIADYIRLNDYVGYPKKSVGYSAYYE